MPVFYPSCAVNLIIRFDEVFLGEQAPPAASVIDLAFGTATPGTPPNSKKPRMLRVEAGALGQPRGTQVLGIVPKAGSFELPGYRQAGKFSFTMPFRDLPLDPRTIRALAVEVYMGTVSSDDFARGIAGERDAGRLLSVLALDDANRRLVGLVDTISSTHSERGSEVTIEGRDLRGIFLDLKVVPETFKDLDLTQSIEEVCVQILSKAPPGAQMDVSVDESEWIGGLPSPGTKDGVTRVMKGADGQKTTSPPKGDSSTLSFWDLITQYCFLCGAIPYFDGYRLRLRPARTIYDQRRAGTHDNPTPFAGQGPREVKLNDGKTLDLRYRRMVYGHNLLKFTLERKLGGVKVPSIRVVAVDTGSKDKGAQKLKEVVFPAPVAGVDAAKVEAAKVTGVDAGGAKAQKDELVIPVHGMASEAQMLEIARAIYEEVGRGEVGGSASSKDLSSFGGDNNDADLVRLGPGDAIDFFVNSTGLEGQVPIVAQMATDASLSDAEAKRQIALRLSAGKRADNQATANDTVMAGILVDTARGRFAKLQSFFRVNNVRYAWDVASGIAVDFDFQNYIEARSDVSSAPVVLTEKNVSMAVGSTPVSRQRIGQ